MFARKTVFLAIILIIIIIPVLIASGIIFFAGDEETSVIRVYKHNSGEIVTMDLNEYLLGVVAAEMPAAYHMEALKAQAVAARTYTERKLGDESKEHPDADVCTDVNHCQAFLSRSEMKSRWNLFNYYYYWSRINSALEETRGEILAYNGEPVEALYHSNGGGYTENAIHVWGTEVPYLKAVKSPYDADRKDNYRHRLVFSVSELETKLGVKIGDKMYSSLQRSESGRVQELKVGEEKFTGREIRKLLGLPATKFAAEREGEKVIFHVLGKGHGVGMSQDGADGLARRGKDYREILGYYYSGTAIVQR
ncbi:MAG: stage II sporulation protein D [Halanaerobiaceae bacterium]